VSISPFAFWSWSVRLLITYWTLAKLSSNVWSSSSDLLSFSIKLLTLFFLGSISLNALAYPSTAKTHLHRPPAASEIVSILDIYIFGSWVNFSILLRVLVGILPLSIFCSLCRKLVSASYFLATAQDGSLLRKIMTALRTTSTPPGGVL